MISIKRKIITNTISNYLLRAVQIILSLTVVPVIIQYVGKEEFGLIALANAILGYFVLIDVGIPTAVTKYIAEYTAKRDLVRVSQIINTALILFIVIGLLVFLMSFIFVNARGLGLFNISSANIIKARRLILLAGCFSLFSWPRKVFEGIFKGLQKFYKVNFVLGLGRILGTALAIWAAMKSGRVEIVFIVLNAEIVITCILLFVLLKKDLTFWQLSLSDVKMSIFKLLFGFSAWLFLSRLANLLEYNSDTIIIGAMMPVYFITAYSIMVNPFRLIQQVSGLAASAVMPAVSENEVMHGKAGVDIFIYKGVKYHNLVFAPVAIVGTYLCRPFVALWVGVEYVQYIWIAQLACLFQLIWQSNAVLGQIYLGTGRVKKLSLVAIGSGLCNIILSIFLARIIGFSGVILGTIIAGVLSVPVALVLWLPDLQVPISRYVKEVLLKAQLPLWITGLLFLPFWRFCQQIDGWLELFTIAALMAFFLYLSGWFFVLDKDVKNRIALSIKPLFRLITCLRLNGLREKKTSLPGDHGD